MAVNAPVAATNWYPTLPCGSSKLTHPSDHTQANVTTGGLNQAARVSQLTLAAWNFSSLLDNPRSNRPERRTAIVARKLTRYKVDIAALSETRFSEQGQLQDVGAGYTFFWNGWPKAVRRDAGVDFAIRNDIVGRLPCLPQAIYEANRIATTKAKELHESPAPRTNTANAQALPTSQRCQRIFRARIGLVGHLQTQCTNKPAIPISTSNSANPPSDSPTLTPGINSITPTIIETTSQY
ncbi:unnamed protein product [Schistocephalus solidus]|uniref:Endonuclease/exonuclease/phosphatase domain-containing protein n=1 Tax=Schistocephalus solidus TaxID=70667 RepID=A0A183TK27_SCHSO|nr:unnamed protein product [Schistocephalus solidus]